MELSELAGSAPSDDKLYSLAKKAPDLVLNLLSAAWRCLLREFQELLLCFHIR